MGNQINKLVSSLMSLCLKAIIRGLVMKKCKWNAKIQQEVFERKQADFKKGSFVAKVLFLKSHMILKQMNFFAYDKVMGK